jgi:hypothetical protein
MSLPLVPRVGQRVINGVKEGYKAANEAYNKHPILGGGTLGVGVNWMYNQLPSQETVNKTVVNTTNAIHQTTTRAAKRAANSVNNRLVEAQGTWETHNGNLPPFEP